MVGPSWVGDMVMAHSLVQVLRQRPSTPTVDILAPGWSLPLIDRMPGVAQGIEMPLGHGRLALGTRRRIGRSLRGAGYGQAVVLPNSWKSALVPWWARIPQRTGYLGEARWGLLNDARRLDPRRLPMTVQRFVALGRAPDEPLPTPLPPPRLEVRPGAVAAALEALGLTRPQRLLALCPGAEYGPAKRWPPEHFAALARHFRSQGWAVWVFGSDRDREAGAAVLAALDGVAADLCGRTSLAQAIDLLSLADLVVSNDSGLMHVAAALDRPVVAVYGSSDPGFTPPLSSRARVVRLGLPCSPCFRRECPLGHLKCLRDLTPERVLAAAQGLAP